MILNDLKEESFKTEIIELRHVGTIFHTKEYEIGKFYKENFSKVAEIYGDYTVDFYSYDDGIIVLIFD